MQTAAPISATPDFRHGTFKAMACSCEVQMFLTDEARAHHAFQMVQCEVRRIEEKYSRYLPQSVIGEINITAGGEPVDVDAETRFLLDHAAACYALSGGLFDITSGVLRRTWDFRSGRPAEYHLLKQALSLVGWERVERQGNRLRLPTAGMEIDFGGIGKEYAVDRACAILAGLGVESALVNLGGDVRILGPRPDGSGWPVHVAHPRQSGQIAATVELTLGAFATSGDYQRFFDFEGKRYCHVLNPISGQPAATWQSVSVASALCLDAGSISTIAMLLESRALPFLTQRGENALLIDQAGLMSGTGLLERFSGGTTKDPQAAGSPLTKH